MSPLHLFRFAAPEGIELGAMTMYGPADEIQGFAVRGQVKATGDPFLSIVFERPKTWPQLVAATKEEREQVQLERFLRDYERSVGEPLALEYTRGDNPPDFQITLSDGPSAGLECTQLVYGDRAHAWSASTRLKRSLLGINRTRFRHLQGQTVYLTVDRPGGLPPEGNNGTREVCEALERFQPAANEYASLPESLAGTDIVQTFGDYTLTAARLGEYAATPFASLMGFELALAIQSDVRGSEAWRMLDDRVRDKDRPGSKLVLVSCGAPVVRGLSFPSDDLAAAAIAAGVDQMMIAPTVHVDTVYLHAWDSELILRLTPGTKGGELLAQG